MSELMIAFNKETERLEFSKNGVLVATVEPDDNGNWSVGFRGPLADVRWDIGWPSLASLEAYIRDKAKDL